MAAASSIPEPWMRLRTLETPQHRESREVTDTNAGLDAHCDYEALYQEVKLEENQFRLLVLPPAEIHDPLLHCQLIVESLDDAPCYIALSYAWRWDCWSYIGINGMFFKVSGQVWGALKRLRHREETVRVWIDAICINQTDALEKTQQVLEMHQIYRKAHEVVIWFADGPDDECQSIVSLVHDFARAAAEHPTSDRDYFKDVQASLITYFPDHDAWKLLHVFFVDMWWRRTWTVQELLLGPSVWVLLGPAELRWDALELSVTFLQNVRDAQVAVTRPSSETAAAAAIKRFPRTIRAAFEDHSDTISEVLSESSHGTSAAPDLKLCPDYSEDNPMIQVTGITEIYFDAWLISARKRFQEERGFELLDLLVDSWERGVADPRDKIYGLYHLIREPRPDLIRPDYTKSAGSLYKELSQYLITKTSNLDVLLYASPLLKDSEQKYPTWCQNWVLEISDNLVLNPSVYLDKRYSRRSPVKFGKRAQLEYRASGSSHPAAEVSDDLLTIKGVWIGKVYVSQSEIVVDKSHPLHKYLGLMGVLFQSGVINDFGDAYPLGGSYTEAFNKVVFHNVDKAADPTTHANAMNEVNEHETMEAYDKFATESGLLGYAFSKVKPLDVICLLYGGKTPFILRPYDMTDEEEPRYHLISPCYVHGVMHGELMDESERLKLGASVNAIDFKII